MLVENNHWWSAALLVKGIVADGHSVTVTPADDEFDYDECEQRGRIKKTSSYSLAINGEHVTLILGIARGSWCRERGKYEWCVRQEWEDEGVEWLLNDAGVMHPELPDIEEPEGGCPW